jgi:hypothetical protein
MDNRYNARNRNTDNRGAPSRRMYMENPVASNGFMDDYRGNWSAGQPCNQGRNAMENTREKMRQQYGPSSMDMRRGPQNMQNMQSGTGMGQMRQGGMGTGQTRQGGMSQNRYNTRQPNTMRRPQEPLGQIYGVQPQGGQMNQPYGRRQMPGNMGPTGGRPGQMRGNYMNPMQGGMRTDGDMPIR